jgi:bifunctional UDP-N-acetylglucosamine pyrophosphorylase/glucosamine-1-phosphate N-acetyltransferase
MQDKLRKRAMDAGVTLTAPETVFMQADTILEADVVVHPFVVFGKNVRVESGAEIRSFSHIEDAVVGKNATVGPYARIRPGAVIGEGAHVGNFVEIKNSRLGKGAKANHLSYVGDSDVGEGANIGAGTITCNYDGVNKHKTVIGAGSFIGSNTALVAPVTVGNNVIIAAGSVITEDIPDDALAISRPQQVNKAAKAKEIRQRRKKNA